MANKNIEDKKDTSSKKDLASVIADLLGPVKEVLKENLSDKKIDKRIKRAAKLLAHGIKPAAAKKLPAKKEPVKKVPVKKETKGSSAVSKKVAKAEQAKPGKS